MEVEKQTSVEVKNGVVSVSFDAKLDLDKDQKSSVESGAYIKVNVAELLEEIGKSKDQQTLQAIAAFIEQMQARIPDFKKEL